jgi:hypothetical protein
MANNKKVTPAFAPGTHGTGGNKITKIAGVGNHTYIVTPSVDSSLSTVIGNAASNNFIPQVDVSAWDGECSLTIHLSDQTKTTGKGKIHDNSVQLTGTATQDADTGNVAFAATDIAASFSTSDATVDYPEGALEFDTTLNSRPVHDKVIYNLDFSNVVFYRQPLMTELIGHDGIVTADDTHGYDALGHIICQCPDNVAGSYAIYHANPPPNTDKSKIYKTGKIGHIYRPKITDNNGDWVWGTLSIDPVVGTITVTVDHQWLVHAAYPIIVDPTFGYTTIGGSSYNFTNARYPICLVGASLAYTASANQAIRKFSAYCSGTAMNMAAYVVTGLLPGTQLASGVALSPGGSAGWISSAFVEQRMVNGTKYGVAIGDFLAGGTTVYYDVGTGTNKSNSTTIQALPNPWVDDGSPSAAMYSIYATYQTANWLTEGYWERYPYDRN